MSKKSTIYIEDEVKIIKPHFFKRCGYPMSLEYALDKIEPHEEDIREVLSKVLGTNPNWKGKYKHMDNIKKLFALAYLSFNKYGGYERSIETFEDNDYINKIYTVVDKKIVRTGRYYKYDEYNNGLINQKSHVILTLDENRKYTYMEPLRIEVCNVEKVTNC